MRLNKNIKDQIIENWKLKKWHKRIEAAKAKAAKDIQSHVKCLLDGCTDEFKDKAIELKLVRAVDFANVYYDDKKYFGSSRISVSTYYLKSNSYVKDFPLSRKARKEISEKFKLMESQESELRGIINSVTTVGKLLEILPECKKYLPKSNQITGTSVSLVSDLEKVKGYM